MNNETLVILTSMKSHLESDIAAIHAKYGESNIPTLAAGVNLGLKTAIKYIDAAMEVFGEEE